MLVRSVAGALALSSAVHASYDAITTLGYDICIPKTVQVTVTVTVDPVTGDRVGSSKSRPVYEGKPYVGSGYAVKSGSAGPVTSAKIGHGYGGHGSDAEEDVTASSAKSHYGHGEGDWDVDVDPAGPAKGYGHGYGTYSRAASSTPSVKKGYSGYPKESGSSAKPGYGNYDDDEKDWDDDEDCEDDYLASYSVSKTYSRAAYSVGPDASKSWSKDSATASASKSHGAYNSKYGSASASDEPEKSSATSKPSSFAGAMTTTRSFPSWSHFTNSSTVSEASAISSSVHSPELSSSSSISKSEASPSSVASSSSISSSVSFPESSSSISATLSSSSTSSAAVSSSTSSYFSSSSITSFTSSETTSSIIASSTSSAAICVPDGLGCIDSSNCCNQRLGATCVLGTCTPCTPRGNKISNPGFAGGQLSPWTVSYFNGQSPGVVGEPASFNPSPDSDGFVFRGSLTGPLFGTRGPIITQFIDIPSGTIVRCSALGSQLRTDGVPTALIMIIDGVQCGPDTVLQNDAWLEHGGQTDIQMFGNSHTVTVLVSGDDGVGSNGVGSGTHYVYVDSIRVWPVDAIANAPSLCPLL